MNEFQRFELQVGAATLELLSKCHIAVFGLGGVGGQVVESLARSGIGTFTVVDCDVIEVTNLNRQIFATQSTLGMKKVDACEARIRDINPKTTIYKEAIKFDSSSALDFTNFDYVVDAVDDINAKVEIIRRAKESKVPVISCMGTGNKFNPLALKVSRLDKTSVCPLARVMRDRLKPLGITDIKCVFSTEQPLKIDGKTISSNAFVPATAGILIAREVVFDLIKEKGK